MKMFFRSQNSSDLLCEKIDLVIKKNNRTIYSNSESSEQFNLGKNEKLEKYLYLPGACQGLFRLFWFF